MLLFKNKRKQPGDKQPDYRSMEPEEINGAPMEAAVWLRKDKNGNTFLSIKFSVPRERNENAPKTQDDIPF